MAVWLSILQLIFSVDASAHGSDKFKSTRWVDLKELRPTQFNVGMGEVEFKRARFEKMGKKKLREYLHKKVARVIVGPKAAAHGAYLWLIDGHHTATALSFLQGSEMRILVEHDWSHLNVADFFKRMIERNKTWLFDNGLGPLNVNDLPATLAHLSDDPYRTLAWRVKEDNGFLKTDGEYAEFKWADFFRTRVAPSDLNRAWRLARSPEASHLPGYISGQ